MFGISLEHVVVSSGYVGILALMVANGFIGFPSSQILYIIVGYFVSTGMLNFYVASFAGAVGNTVGNVILYEVSRRKGIAYITQYKMFPTREVQKVEIAFRKKGAWFLFFGKLLPAIKVFVPIPAGFGKMNRALYTAIIFISSFLWSFIFIAIGYYFGKSADVFGSYAVVLMIVAFVVVALFYKYMNSEEITREIEK